MMGSHSFAYEAILVWFGFSAAVNRKGIFPLGWYGGSRNSKISVIEYIVPSASSSPVNELANIEERIRRGGGLTIGTR